MALENLGMQGMSMAENSSRDEWDELLKQYDRYDDCSNDDGRRSKRASRNMNPLPELPAEVPIVDEPTVVLDCHNFPPAFKTHHLRDIFREYENMRGGYRIKWVDDTRALIIFEHPATAKKAYIDNVTNPLAKIRPFDGPIELLRSSGIQTPSRPSSIDMSNKRLSMNSKR